MKKIFLSALITAVLIAAAVAAQTASAPAAPAPAAAAPTEDPEAIRTVEVSAAIAGGDRAAAKKSARSQAMRAALREYLELQVPLGVLKTKAAQVEKIFAEQEKLVADTQELGSREESGKLVVKYQVKIKAAEVRSRLSAAGLLPSGPLPEVFVMVRGVGMGDDFRSAWDRDAPESGENVCEAALSSELGRYGFAITPARSGEADTARILSPGNEAERAEVFRYVKDKFGSGALVVGVVSAEGEMKPRLKLRLAVADTGQERLLWSGARERVAADADLRSRNEALVVLCRAAGEEAVLALYQASLPSLVPGTDRELTLAVEGIDRWVSVKEMEKKLRTELPGVTGVSYSRMSPGLIEFKVQTALASKSIAAWLASNQFGGMTMKVTEAGDYLIKLQAQPPDPNAQPTGTGPTVPASGSRPAPATPKPTPR